MLIIYCAGWGFSNFSAYYEVLQGQEFANYHPTLSWPPQLSLLISSLPRDYWRKKRVSFLSFLFFSFSSFS